MQYFFHLPFSFLAAPSLGFFTEFQSTKLNASRNTALLTLHQDQGLPVIMWPFSSTCKSKARLVGKTIVITGGNSGIGKETARDFYRRGARVILACRDTEKANAAVEDMKLNPPSKPERKQFQGNPGELSILHLDLTSLQSIKNCARTLLDTEPAIHILVNNAAIFSPFQKTQDGFELNLQTNFLGHFLLTLLLLPRLQESTPGVRIVNVASAAYIFAHINFDDLNHERHFWAVRSYGQSKLANILFTRELAKRLRESKIEGINVYSLHPGIIRTQLGRSFDSIFFRGARTMFRSSTFLGGKSPESGAQTTIYCAVDEEAGKETGHYYTNCSTAWTLPRARNDHTASRLWNRSCELLGFQPHEDLSDLLKEAAAKSFISD